MLLYVLGYLAFGSSDLGMRNQHVRELNRTYKSSELHDGTWEWLHIRDICFIEYHRDEHGVVIHDHSTSTRVALDQLYLSRPRLWQVHHFCRPP